MSVQVTHQTLNAAQVFIVRVRDEDWLVTAVEPSMDGMLVRVHGPSEIDRYSTAAFYNALDTIEVPIPPMPRS